MMNLTIISKSEADCIYFTLLTSKEPVVKKYLADGTKVPAANIYEGGYQIASVSDLQEFDTYCNGLSTYQTITIGLPKNKMGKLTTLKQLDEIEEIEETTIARSQQFLKYINDQFDLLLPNSYSLYLFDVDFDRSAPEHFKVEGVEQMRKRLLTIAPILNGIQMLIRPSSSNGIKHSETGEYRSNNASFHIYLIVANATNTNVKRFTDYMKQMCYEHGLYYISADKGGSVREKFLFDFAVAKPERLIFEARPIVIPPYVKEEVASMFIDGGILDLASNVFDIELTFIEALQQEKELYRAQVLNRSTARYRSKSTPNVRPPKKEKHQERSLQPLCSSQENLKKLVEYFSYTKPPHRWEYAQELLDDKIVKAILVFLGYDVAYNYKFKIRQEENTPSASIHPKGFIKDFGSNWGGSIISFIAEVYDLDFKTAFKYFSNLFGARHRIASKTKSLPNWEDFKNFIKLIFNKGVKNGK